MNKLRPGFGMGVDATSVKNHSTKAPAAGPDRGVSLRVASPRSRGEMPIRASSTAPSPDIQRVTIASLASGWNCVPKQRPDRMACGPTSLNANTSTEAGALNTSACHCIHVPATGA